MPDCWRLRFSRRRGPNCGRSSRRIGKRSPPTSAIRNSEVGVGVASTILPGSTIGVLGGGQLGRMFAMAARCLGYRVHTLAPDHDTPTGQIADVEINASYDDMDAVRAFAQAVDVVTFEFEHVSAEAVAEAERHAIVRPNGRSLADAQHRLKEKTFLVEHGLPVAPFATVRNAEDLDAAAGIAGCPSILK